MLHEVQMSSCDTGTDPDPDAHALPSLHRLRLQIPGPEARELELGFREQIHAPFPHRLRGELVHRLDTPEETLDIEVLRLRFEGEEETDFDVITCFGRIGLRLRCSIHLLQGAGEIRSDPQGNRFLRRGIPEWIHSTSVTQLRESNTIIWSTEKRHPGGK